MGPFVQAHPAELAKMVEFSDSLQLISQPSTRGGQCFRQALKPMHTSSSSANPSSPTPPEGILVVDKPLGMTSMTAVAIVRRMASQSQKEREGGKRALRRIKTGHAGTLDPLATGVLVIALGRATRAISRLMATDKRYETEIDLTAFTTTDDAEGDRTEIPVSRVPTADEIERTLQQFVGTIQQKPPAYSAVKIDGKRAYKLARQGKAVDVPARPVTVYDIKLLEYAWPRVRLAIHCGKGFYVRSLARDLGLALGTGGHCVSIRRTAVGPFTLSMTKALDSLPSPLQQGDVIPLEDALQMVDATT